MNGGRVTVLRFPLVARWRVYRQYQHYFPEDGRRGNWRDAGLFIAELDRLAEGRRRFEADVLADLACLPVREEAIA